MAGEDGESAPLSTASKELTGKVPYAVDAAGFRRASVFLRLSAMPTFTCTPYNLGHYHWLMQPQHARSAGWHEAPPL